MLIKNSKSSLKYNSVKFQIIEVNIVKLAGYLSTSEDKMSEFFNCMCVHFIHGYQIKYQKFIKILLISSTKIPMVHINL